MYDHGVYVGNIQTGLNDGGGHQYIDLPVHKIKHDPLQFSLLHLAMGIGHVGLRHQRRNLSGNITDIADPVVHIINLTAPGQFTGDCLTHHLLIVFADKCLDGQAVVGRLLQHAHIPDADETHVQCPGNRGGCQRQYIHVFF